MTDRKAVHVLSAFASDAVLVLAHQELAGAPDEVAAVPKLRAELGLTGVLFPAQTLHISPTPTRCIARRTALRRLPRPAMPFWSASRTTSLPCTRRWPGCAPSKIPSTTMKRLTQPQTPGFRRGRHGRQEHRRVEVFDTAGFPDAPWQALVSCVARVSRLTSVKDTRSGLWATREEVGYYPCQARHGAKLLGGAIRAHWGIENRAHYVRNVTLGEDASRIRTRPGIMARIRSIALNVLRASGVQNTSLALYANAVSFDHLLALGTA